jgi:hypothetical protein
MFIRCLTAVVTSAIYWAKPPSPVTAQPALAAYAEDPGDKLRRPYGVMVFACEGNHIAGITGFPQPVLFELFGLPAFVPVNARSRPVPGSS